jgi:hypothetical protein
MFNSSHSIVKTLNQIEATDEIIEGKELLRSKQLAQPIRSNLQTEGMSNNLRGETILMACSSFFLVNKNITEEKLTLEPNTNISSSSKVNLGKFLQWKKNVLNNLQKQNQCK